jgi:membrane-associated phospholipid phosphatase
MYSETAPGTSVSVSKRKEQKGKKTSLFTVKSVLFCALGSALYLALSYWLIGSRADQFILVGIFNGCFFASRVTRRFITGFSIFILYWIIFDYMKVFPNYLYNDVHIQSLYEMEKTLFGIRWENTILTPNEYFARHTSLLLDTMAGIFYLCWIPVPLSFAAILFFKNRKTFFQFALTFFIVNIIGFIGYYLYPAAPPWYVAQQGFEFIAKTPGSPAGLIRFDNHYNVTIFKDMYAKSSNVFAAMPSMHSAFVLIVLFFGLKHRMKAWNLLFATILAGIWFSAVYTGHHYILDVLGGIFSAILGIFLIQWWSNSTIGRRILKQLISITSD